MQTLNSIVKIIIENWYLFIAAIAVTAVVSIAIYKFFKQPSEDQIYSLKEWLLYAVAIAEKKFGSSTGELKLRYVYDLFLKAFPALTDYISFENFFLSSVLFNFNVGVIKLFSIVKGSSTNKTLFTTSKPFSPLLLPSVSSDVIISLSNISFL